MEWKKLSTREVVSLNDYIHEWLESNEDHKIYIGCDSQDTTKRTTFAVVIVLHNKNKGGHVLYDKMVVPKITSAYERLWKEVELSVETAQTIMDFGIQPDYIDIDLNPDPKYKSNSLLRSAVGLVESLGIEARYKSMSPWSIRVADNLCRKPSKKKMQIDI